MGSCDVCRDDRLVFIGHSRFHALGDRCRNPHAVASMINTTDPKRMVFRVQQQGDGWLVRLGDATWGQYPGRRQALKIAVVAARDAQRQGYRAKVWDASRRFWRA